MTKVNLTSRQKVAEKILAQRKELHALRNAVVMSHGMCTGNYIQDDSEMRERAGKRLAKGINESRWCRSILGYGESLIPIK